jgi:hypothetical protein
MLQRAARLLFLGWSQIEWVIHLLQLRDELTLLLRSTSTTTSTRVYIRLTVLYLAAASNHEVRLLLGCRRFETIEEIVIVKVYIQFLGIQGLHFLVLLLHPEDAERGGGLLEANRFNRLRLWLCLLNVQSVAAEVRTGQFSKSQTAELIFKLNCFIRLGFSLGLCQSNGRGGVKRDPKGLLCLL